MKGVLSDFPLTDGVNFLTDQEPAESESNMYSEADWNGLG